MAPLITPPKERVTTFPFGMLEVDHVEPGDMFFSQRLIPFAMCLQNVINLGVSPVNACVKVDDTIPGVEEGLNAGMWTVGLAMSGNEIGLSLKEVQALDPADHERRPQRAYTRMYRLLGTKIGQSRMTIRTTTKRPPIPPV